MSPGPRRDFTPFVIALGVGAVILFLFVGGLASVGRSSGPYRTSIAGSFGAQASVVVSQSNSVGTELTSLVQSMPGLDRSHLSLGLDEVFVEAQRVASSAEQVSSSGPGGTTTSDFVTAMRGRAEAVGALRSTVDGLLEITPVGYGTTSQPSPFPPPAVNVPRAVQVLTGVGRQLIQSDHAYQQVRRNLAAVPGGRKLPASVWVPRPVLWSAGAVGTMVNQLASSPTLAPTVDVALVAVSVNPPLLPPVAPVKGQPPGPAIPAGAIPVPPTCTVVVTAVVRNEGTVVAKKVAVRGTVQPVAGGAAFLVQKGVTLAPGASTAVALPAMAVLPATAYNLSVTLDPPPGQAGPVGSESATIAVAAFGSARANATCAHTPAAAP
jgi:hypothetical protein